MSEPNLNSEEWPKTEAGHVDWEHLFEVPKTGFIPYIKSAGVPPKLRFNALQIIRALFTRKDDSKEVDRLSTELYELIPDEISNERFPVIGGAVVQAMREIKSYRINKAIEFDRQKEAEGKGSERRGAKTGRQSIKKPLGRRNLYIGGSIAASLLVLAAGAYFILAPEKKVQTLDSPRGLLAQMEYAATGGGVKTHVYGGQLRSERRRGDITVVAVGVPNSACVEVGASLATRGRLTINGLRPKARTRPAVVSLCKSAGEKITLRWVPDKQ